MPIYNNAVYDAVQVTPLTYTLTLQANKTPIPANAGSLVMGLKDDTDQYAWVKMDSSGSTFTVTRIYSSSQNDNLIPTWGSGLICFSTDVAEVLNIPTQVAVVLGSGQSNVTGKNEGRTNIDSKYFREKDVRWMQSNYNDNSGNPDPDQILAYAEEDLLHIATSTIPGSLGPLLPFIANLEKEGWSKYIIVPMGAVNTKIETFQQGQPNYNAMLGAMTEVLNADDNYEWVAWIHQQGETDAVQSTPTATYQAQHVQMVTDLRADVEAATGRDCSRVPHLAPLLHGDFNASIKGPINTAIENAVDQLDYAATVTLPSGLSRASNQTFEPTGTTDTTHIAAVSMPQVGRLMYEQLDVARIDFNTDFSTVLVGGASETESAISITPSVTGPIVIPVGNSTESDIARTITADASGLVVPVGNATETDTSLVVTGDNTGPYPLTAATNPTAYYRRDNGLNDTAGSYDSWTNLLGTGPNLGAATFGAPTVSADGVEFAGADVIPLPDSFFTDTNGSTCVLKFKGTAGTLWINHLSSFYNPSTGVVGWQRTGSSGNEVSGAGLQLNDGNWHTLEISMNPLFGTGLRVRVDGVLIGDATAVSVNPASDGDGGLGGRRTGGNYMTGTVSALYWKEGGALTDSELDDVIAEMGDI